MSTRIRLQRHGKKGNPIFHLVVADSRAKRDGKFIEKLGIYNPNTNPATIEINFDSTLNWVQTGAEMSETARAILSYKGILFKNHLLNGIKKGALTAEQVEEKFAAWEAEKATKIDSKKNGLVESSAAEKTARMAAETEKNAAKAKAVEAKNTPAVEEVPAVEETEEPTAEAEVTEETATEEAAPVAEETAPAVEEAAPVAEAAAPEAPAAEETTTEEAAPEAKTEGEAEA